MVLQFFSKTEVDSALSPQNSSECLTFILLGASNSWQLRIKNYVHGSVFKKVLHRDSEKEN